MNLRAVILLASSLYASAQDATPLALDSSPHARFQFKGFVGERIRRTAENWLQPAPVANPGMFEMFEMRDREPAPDLVPWAGEFAGKYLISAIQGSRVGASVPDLASHISRLIASQADDGYLGPFRKNERLLGHWDLWGHYHCLLALLMWHEQTGDLRALDCARRAADLVCKTFLDSGKRAFDAGADEMNLSIIHALGWLYRVTQEPRYLRMMRELEKDWERGGDFLRAGLAGVEFFQTPRPRWEGLHSLQGLVELYRITGEQRYRTAFEHHWRSIARWDLRNTGGFSSGEQATGNPYAPTAIETCCSIAWMALSIDRLKLSSDSRVADSLELATLNAWAGAQHPSGRWCTYNTPMDGVREASAHSIAFQARAGTPELNCCSVNGPRGWGMLGDWAIMTNGSGYVLNWLGPFTATFPEGGQISVSGEYPSASEVTIRVALKGSRENLLKIRIPEWSVKTSATLNGQPLSTVVAGTYLEILRKWKSDPHDPDTLKIRLDFTPRVVPGAREALGKVSIYRGPLLLAWDQRYNNYDDSALPPLQPASIRKATLAPASPDRGGSIFRPEVLLRISGEREIILCDFASAGALGTRYRSWLPATNIAPAPVTARFPRDGATLGHGPVVFRWTGSGSEEGASCTLQISSSERFTNQLVDLQNLKTRQVLIPVGEKFEPSRLYYWHVITRNSAGETISTGPASVFRVDPARLENQSITRRSYEPDGAILRFAITNGVLNGVDKKLPFQVGEWPEENYAVELRCKISQMPSNRLAQIFSAWAGPSDDPLRLVIDQGRLFARMEMGTAYSTPGIALETERWYRISARKEGSRLRLSIDGRERAQCTVPQFVSTRSHDFALGGNPHFPGNEFLAAEFTEIAFFGTDD